MEKNHKKFTFGKKREMLEKIRNHLARRIVRRSRKIPIWKVVGRKP